jgi:ureidoglycolate hydrolase
MRVEEVKIINLEEVTDEEFAPYGQIWGREKGEPYKTLEYLKYYSDNVDLGPQAEWVDGGLLVCNKKGRIIKYFERHPENSESFVPIEGDCIFVMAPVDNTKDKPDISRIKAFYMNGSLGVALPPGNWHWPPIPLGEIVKLILVRKGTQRNPFESVDLEDLGIDEIRLTF